jgi:uncharacterized protein YbaR (Trm112 family)
MYICCHRHHFLASAHPSPSVSHILYIYKQIDDATKTDEAFLKLVHKLLLDVHVLEGALICPETGRRFPITAGIPNMLLHEDEVA